MVIDQQQRFQRNENFVFRRIEDEIILVPIKENVGDMGNIYSLNEIGALIWEHLDGKQKLATIKEKIIVEYDVSPREAGEDLNAFVTDLIEIKAVNLVSDAGA